MAIAANTSWDVRTTGSDTNGGGFNGAATGTDFSQQSAAQIAFTDLVIGATNTTITSASHPFGATHVGNIINVTSGTGFTVQRVQIVSVTGVIATCDKAVGTAASTGGVGNLGGSLATPIPALAAMVSNNTVWIATGTYNFSATLTTIALTNNGYIIGYNTTHGDYGTAPTLNMTASSIALWTIGSAALLMLANLNLTTSATTKSVAITNTSGTTNLCLSGLSMSGFTIGVGAEGGISGTTPSSLAISGCAIQNCTSMGVAFGSAMTSFENCYFSGNVGADLSSSQIDANATIDRCLFISGSAQGILFAGGNGSVRVLSCTFNGKTSCVQFTDATLNFFLIARSNIFYGNAVGINLSGQTKTYPQAVFSSNNAYGANSTADRVNANAGAGDIALTANPFVGGTNFALNSTTGGGAACKGLGYPGVFPGGTTSGNLDIGAVQSTGSGTIQNYSYSG